MMVPTYPVSFSSIACIYFSKWRHKIFGSGNQPTYTKTLTGYPPPPSKVVPRFCFAKMTAKDELKGIKKLYTPPPFGRRGLIINSHIG